MSPAEFWRSTPREALDAIDAAAWRAKEQHRLALEAAWYVAALSRQERLPRLERLVPPEPVRQQPLTPEGEWAFWQAFAVAVNAGNS